MVIVKHGIKYDPNKQVFGHRDCVMFKCECGCEYIVNDNENSFEIHGGAEGIDENGWCHSYYITSRCPECNLVCYADERGPYAP